MSPASVALVLVPSPVVGAAAVGAGGVHGVVRVRRGGVVSVPGVYAGPIHGFLFGDAFDKGLTFKMGQTHVHNYLPQLLEHIENGDLSPDLIITHRMKLEDAAEGYRIFDKKEEDCRKVILTP